MEPSPKEVDLVQRSKDKAKSNQTPQPSALGGRSGLEELVQGRYADPDIYIGAEDDNEITEFIDEIENLIGEEEHTEDDELTNDPTDEISRSISNCQLIPTFQLPKDLLYEVFLRLPVKSLLRFRCVSKGMYGMIDSSDFISNRNNHRSVIITERDGSLPDDDDEDYAVFLQQRNNNNRLFSMHFDDNNLNRAKAIELDSTFAKEGMMEAGSCCNGIFLFMNRGLDPTSYVLWNPSNCTFREVDDCSSCLKSSNVSIGYDYVNDDYKIISLIDINGQTGLEVYSSRNDSWRKFPRDFPPGVCGFESAVCVGGVMHWLWTNLTDYIAAFDLVTEAFTSLPLPREAIELNLDPYGITDFGGRLCVSFYPSDGDAPTVWVMEEYGVGSSWIKLCNFDLPIFYFPNKERRLMSNSHLRGLSWRDPEDDTFERIEITGPSYDRYIWAHAYVYVMNLVRLARS